MNKILNKIKYIRYVLLWIIILIVAGIMLTKISTIEESISVLKIMPLWMIGAAVMAQICSYLSSGYQLREIVNIRHKRISLLRGVLIYVAGESVGLAGGMASTATATYLWVAGDEEDTGEATLAGFMPIIYNSAVLITVTTAGMLYLLFQHDLSKGQIIFYGTILASLIIINIVSIYGLGHRKEIERFVFGAVEGLNRLRKKKFEMSWLHSRFNNFYNAVALLKNRSWLKCGTGSILNIIFDMLTLYIFFVAAGYPIKPGVLIAGYSLAFLFGRTAFVVPGGSGIIESGMVAIFISLGNPIEVSVISVLGYRFLSFWFPSLLGFGAMLYLQRFPKRQSPLS